MKSLVAVGACYVDTILTVDHYPSEDEKLRASSISRRRGGNVPNLIEVLQQLLESTEMEQMSLKIVAVLPATLSAGTKQVKESFTSGVDLRHCICREAFREPASSYIIRSQSSGSRTVVNYNDLPEMTAEEFFQIAKTTLECIRYLRQQFTTVKISVEVEKPSRPGLQELAAEADVVVYSKSWAQGNGYQSLEECLRAQAVIAHKASLLLCTWGKDGAAALIPSSSIYVFSPAYIAENLQVIDTIGAGDTFMAGMLYGLICHGDDWSLLQKLQFANKIAGIKVVQEGFPGLGASLQTCSSSLKGHSIC
ncbi:hypothetical protein Egran_06641 [Elaphomyces granulatus]|uniref:Carbohydrate kinase PfkB domain-containing protein n=1 Tax=Elaphomyces granulatus TaxID=519963 RepID=A0A232LN50_9EURO|nr:hypothetical protein Egran_06641 [Elaphomyces granulatus]